MGRTSRLKSIPFEAGFVDAASSEVAEIRTHNPTEGQRFDSSLIKQAKGRRFTILNSGKPDKEFFCQRIVRNSRRPRESGRGQPHSKTWRSIEGAVKFRDIEVPRSTRNSARSWSAAVLCRFFDATRQPNSNLCHSIHQLGKTSVLSGSSC